MMESDPLSQLKDLHIPNAIGWWPPAPGWWMVGIVFVLITGFIAFKLFKRHRFFAYKREAQIKMDLIQTHYQQSTDNRILLRNLSELLKRVCITYYGRESVAGLSGKEWLQFLDKTGKTNQFSRGAGQALSFEKYSRQPNIDGNELIRISQHWLRQQS